MSGESLAISAAWASTEAAAAWTPVAGVVSGGAAVVLPPGVSCNGGMPPVSPASVALTDASFVACFAASAVCLIGLGGASSAARVVLALAIC